MKKKFIEALKAKFVGIDDNTANRLAERAFRKGDPITTDDEVTVAVEAITLSDVLKSVSDFSADDATRKYEAKYNLKDGEKVVKDDPKKPDPDPTPDPKDKNDDEIEKIVSKAVELALKPVTDKFDALQTSITTIRQNGIVEERKGRLSSILKGLSDNQKKPYGRISLKDMSEEEFEQFLNETSEEVSDILAEQNSIKAKVTAPLGLNHEEGDGKVKEASDSELDAVMKNLV